MRLNATGTRRMSVLLTLVLLLSLLPLSVHAAPDTTLGVERINATTLRLTAANAAQYQFDVREMGQQDYFTIRGYDAAPVFDWNGAADGKLYEMVAHGIDGQGGYAGYYVVFGNTAPEAIVPFNGVGMTAESVGDSIQITAIPNGGTNVIYALQYRALGGTYNPLDPSNPYQATTTFMLNVPYGDYELVVHAIDMAAGQMIYYGSYTPFTHEEVPIQYATTETADFDIAVDFGTSENNAAAELAGTVGVIGTLGEAGQASIAWSITDYDSESAGDYTAAGELTLPEGWTGSPANVSATVTVLEEVVTAGIPYTEDFTGMAQGSIPPGWHRDNDNWVVWNATTDTAGGQSPEMRYYGWAQPEGAYRLISPAIDTTGYRDIELSFRQFVKNNSSSSFTYGVYVQVSKDGGSTWSTVWSTYPVLYNIGPETVTLDLSAYDGDTIQIAWLFNGVSQSLFHWAVDDIVVNGEDASLPRMYDLTLQAEPEAGGTVSGGGSYAADTIVPLNAIANPGYNFVEWRKDAVTVSTDAAFAYVMPAQATSLTAHFEEEPPFVPEGTLVHASTANGRTGLLYHRDSNLYYAYEEDEEWVDEWLVGEGTTEGKLYLTPDKNAHIAYTTATDEIGYKVEESGTLSLIGTLPSQNSGVCNKPDIAVGLNGLVYIVYTDTRGDLTGTTQNDDVMLATHNGTDFSVSLKYSGWYDSSWKYGTYYDKGALIAISGSNHPYFFHQWRTYEHSWSVYHDRGIVVEEASSSISLGYIGSNTNQFDLYDLFEANGKLFAVYRDGANHKVAEITRSGNTITGAAIELEYGSIAGKPSVAVAGDYLVAAGRTSGSNLRTHINGAESIHSEISVTGDVQPVIYANGDFCVYYTDSDDANIIKKLLLTLPPL